MHVDSLRAVESERDKFKQKVKEIGTMKILVMRIDLFEVFLILIRLRSRAQTSIIGLP